jgi:tetratricopeptide (TPR) repeat protein
MGRTSLHPVSAERLAQLQELLQEEPGDAFLLYAIALELNRLGRSEEAIAELQQLLADRPEHVPSYYQLAMLLGEMSRTAEAIAVCEAGALRCIVSGDRKARAELLSLKAVLEENVD